MTGQYFFTTVAGLALSVAGFASLVTALRREGRWSRTDLWRLRAIVGESLTITVVAMLPLPIYYAAGGDEPFTIRAMSALIALKFLLAVRTTIAERNEWGRGYFVQALIAVAAQAVAQIANVSLGWIALLMLGLLLWLAYPIQLLFAIIRDFQPPTEGD
jgi:hypothetical protein